MDKQHSTTEDNSYPANVPPQKQVIPENGEQYLREVANIEDTPSPAEDDEAQKTIDESAKDKRK